MALWDWIKSHALVSGIIAFVVFIGVLWFSSSPATPQQVTTGGATADTGVSDGSQQQQIAAALAAHSMDTQASLSANSDNNATAVSLAQIQKDIAAGQFAVQSQQITVAGQTQALESTLAARVADNQTSAQTQQLQITTQGSVDTTRIFTNALVQQSTNQLQGNLAAINAQRDIATQSWVDKIFG